MSSECLQPVAVFWDIENCAIPQGVHAEYVAVHIRRLLKAQLAVKGPITVFYAYGDISLLPRHTRQGCHKTGVNLIDIPHGKKDAADKAILVDMFLFALDNPPPCTVVLISGDVDFAPALHKLGQRGYCVVLAVPSGLKLSPALCNACQYLWSWPDVALGKGLNLVETPSLCMIDVCKPFEAAEMVKLNAKNECINQAKGKGPAKIDFVDGIEGNHDGFNNLEAGPGGNQNGSGNSRKIPVGMFEETVKVPLHFDKESTEMQFATLKGITSYYDNVLLKSQNLNGGVASSKIAPPKRRFVCDQFALPYSRSATHMLGEEGFGHSWKKHGHRTKADSHRYVQGPITRSQTAQKVSANSKHTAPTSKKMVHTQRRGPPSQLKVKKKKMKKTKAPIASPKLSKKQRKAARLAVLQAQGMLP